MTVETCYPAEIASESPYVEVEPEEEETITLSEPEMCVQAIIDVLGQNVDEEFDTSEDSPSPKVLDFCAGNGQMGHLLADQGFKEVYG